VHNAISPRRHKFTTRCNINRPKKQVADPTINKTPKELRAMDHIEDHYVSLRPALNAPVANLGFVTWGGGGRYYFMGRWAAKLTNLLN